MPLVQFGLFVEPLRGDQGLFLMLELAFLELTSDIRFSHTALIQREELSSNATRCAMLC